MKTQQQPAQSKSLNQSWLVAVIILVLALAIYAITRLYSAEDQYTILPFSGKGQLTNFSKTYNLAHFEKDSMLPGAIIAQKGDLLFFNSFITFYAGQAADTLRFRDEGDSLLYINDKLNAINLSANFNQLPLFSKIDPATMANLELLVIDGPIPESYLPFLQQVAAENPGINLLFTGDDSTHTLQQYIANADFFSPRKVAASIQQEEAALLTRWNNLEALYLTYTDSLVTTALPAIPGLQQFFITISEDQVITPALLQNNPQVRKLTVFNNGSNYPLPSSLDQLESLTLENLDSFDISNLLPRKDQLQSLILSGYCDHIDSLVQFKQLRWLGLPFNTTQEQFNTIVTGLPKMEILEISHYDSSLNSYSALLPLSNLYGLLIYDTVMDRQTLQQLQQLRYLSVTYEPGDAEDSILIHDLQKALPGCVVVPNTGACLGSGWLLCIVPLTLLFAAITVYRKRKQTQQL